MTARTWDGRRLTPGVNVDPINLESGLKMAERIGFLRDVGFPRDSNDTMVVHYALQRHARGEEEGAERTWLGHFGPRSLTGWRMVLAAAVAGAPARPRLFLRYANEGRTPWKWHGLCPCGWNILSWDWNRALRHLNNHLKEKHSGE